MSEHVLPEGRALIARMMALGRSLGYEVKDEFGVNDGRHPSEVDVAWFVGEETKYPLVIIEVESGSTNGMAMNPAKVYGQPTESFERPLFFFHLIVKSGSDTSRPAFLRELFGKHNYRLYELSQPGVELRLICDVIGQHRRVSQSVDIESLARFLLNEEFSQIDVAHILNHAIDVGLVGNYRHGLASLAVEFRSEQAISAFVSVLKRDTELHGLDRGYDSAVGDEVGFPIEVAILQRHRLIDDDLALKRLRDWIAANGNSLRPCVRNIVATHSPLLVCDGHDHGAISFRLHDHLLTPIPKAPADSISSVYFNDFRIITEGDEQVKMHCGKILSEAVIQENGGSSSFDVASQIEEVRRILIRNRNRNPIAIAAAIRNVEHPPVRRILWVVLAGVARYASRSRQTTYKLHVVADDDEGMRGDETIDLFKRKALEAQERYTDFWATLRANGHLRKNAYNRAVDIYCRDVRQALPSGDRFADVVITSPPYGDNRSTIPYGQYSYLPLAWVDFKDIGSDAAQELATSAYAIDAASLGGGLRGADSLAPLLAGLSPTFARVHDGLRKMPADRQRRLTAFTYDMYQAIDRIVARVRAGGHLLLAVTGDAHRGVYEIVPCRSHCTQRTIVVPTHDNDAPRQLLTDGRSVAPRPKGDIAQVEHPIIGSDARAPRSDEDRIMLLNRRSPCFSPRAIRQDIVVAEMRVADNPSRDRDVTWNITAICNRYFMIKEPLSSDLQKHPGEFLRTALLLIVQQWPGDSSSTLR